jgi:hypothetical protein
VVADKEEAELNEKVLPLEDMLLNHPSRNNSHPCTFNLEDLNEWHNILLISKVKCSQQKALLSSFVKSRNNCQHELPFINT